MSGSLYNDSLRLHSHSQKEIQSVLYDVVIRDATFRDLPAIVDIYNYYITKPGDLTTFEEVEIDVAEIEKRFKYVTQEIKFPYIVITLTPATTSTTSTGDNESLPPAPHNDNEYIVGYAYGRFYGERYSYRFSCENSIYLREGYNGAGLGSAILAILLKLLRARGICQVVAVLGTQEDNAASYYLHAKFGFVEVALFPKIGYKYGQWVDRVHMQKSLLEENQESPHVVY